jgi:dTDP-4-dehydrorhamnose reductase
VQKILVTGANGQLGSELRELSFFQDQYEWIFTDWQELDLSNLQNLADNITTISQEGNYISRRFRYKIVSYYQRNQ